MYLCLQFSDRSTMKKQANPTLIRYGLLIPPTIRGGTVCVFSLADRDRAQRKEFSSNINLYICFSRF